MESLTTVAALAHRVPGKWIGIAVAANTFRHPAMLAKQATVIDNVTGGRFILGLGAGWHEGEHESFGIPLPAMPERYDRFESALRVLTALFSDEARRAPGVTLDDPAFPLHNATNEPGPVRPGGPAIWLGGQKRGASRWRRDTRRAGRCRATARATSPTSAPSATRSPARSRPRAVTRRRSRSPPRCRAARRRTSRREALETARAFLAAGANHVILGVPATMAPDGLAVVADEVAEPLVERAAASSPA